MLSVVFFIVRYQFPFVFQFVSRQTGAVRLGTLQVERIEPADLVWGLGEWPSAERLLRRQTLRVSLQSSDDRLQLRFSGRPRRFDSFRQTAAEAVNEEKPQGERKVLF